MMSQTSIWKGDRVLPSGIGIQAPIMLLENLRSKLLKLKIYGIKVSKLDKVRGTRAKYRKNKNANISSLSWDSDSPLQSLSHKRVVDLLISNPFLFLSPENDSLSLSKTKKISLRSSFRTKITDLNAHLVVIR